MRNLSSQLSFLFFLWPFYDLLWLFSPRGCNNLWPRLVQRTARFPFLGNLLILFQRSRNNEQLNLASHLVGRPDIKISKFTKCKRQKNPPMQRATELPVPTHWCAFYSSRITNFLRSGQIPPSPSKHFYLVHFKKPLQILPTWEKM